MKPLSSFSKLSLLLFLVSLISGCTGSSNSTLAIGNQSEQTDSTELKQPKDSLKVNFPTFNVNDVIKTQDYDVQFRIDSLGNNEFELEVYMELAKGSFFVSPHSKGDYMGQWNISLVDSTNLEWNDEIVESPVSQETIDPWEGGLVNFVEESTSYKQKFKLLTEENFKVLGLIRFVIEPRCTMQHVRFIITYNSGKIQIKKMDPKDC